MKPPTKATLRKYGLTANDWWSMLQTQGGCCALCGRDFTKTPAIDHLHVRGWKSMKPARRRTYVRGLICSYRCNRLLLGPERFGFGARDYWQAAEYLNRPRPASGG